MSRRPKPRRLQQKQLRADDQWFVELDGEPVAVLRNPRFSDQFWFTWELCPVGDALPDDLWSYAADERRSFRHCFKDYRDKYAFPATDHPVGEDGRVLIRGPLRR